MAEKPPKSAAITGSQHAKLHAVGLGQSRSKSGFWGDRFRLCCDVMVPTMGKLMTQTERARFVGNFEVAAGVVEGRHRGPTWNDGDFYKWLEAAATVYALTKDSQLDAEMDRLIALIARAQRDDGYIHTDVQIRRRAGEPVEPFDNPMDFEMYNMGHLMTAACVHHRATGKSNLLKLATKTADFLDKTFARPTPRQARHGICPSHLMGLVELYRTTRQRRYLDLAVRLLNMRDLVVNGDDDNQDRIPLRRHTKAHGHAVRATYLYAGAADIYAETGDRSLLKPLQAVWQDLVSRKLYITGGCGALYDGASPDGSADQKIITRVHQAFGRDYQLPHSTAHNETCAAIGNLLWNWRMLLITGEARFADIIELTLYNSVLAGISLDGTAFFYTNTLRQLDPMPVELRWPRQRQKFISCFCCPPNVVRTIAQSSTYAYARSRHGVYVVLYGSSRLDTTLPDGARVALAQQTDYPWDGRVKIIVEAAPRRQVAISLRIPLWARGATLRVNGRRAGSPGAGRFHEVRRKWSSGDTVELVLPMRVRLIEAHPYVEEARNHVAVMRGPIVYCLESTDLPRGVRVLDVCLPRKAKLVPLRTTGKLGDVVLVKCRAVASAAGEWSGHLYRDIAAAKTRSIDLTLIPYYAWDNRGKSEMTVWLPVVW